MTRTIDTAEVAKIIRSELKSNFPGVKFFVKSSRYSGGSSITVEYTDGPATDTVKATIGHFHGATFDGMQDLKEYHKSEYNGESVYFGNDFLNIERNYSKQFCEGIKTYMLTEYAGLYVTEQYTDGALNDGYIKIEGSETFGYHLNSWGYSEQARIHRTMAEMSVADLEVALKPAPEPEPIVEVAPVAEVIEIIEETAQEAQTEAEQENVQIASVEADSATPGEVCEEDSVPAAFIGTALDGIETDIDLELATRAHNGTSFSPEQRGRGEVANWIEFMRDDYTTVMKHGKTDDERRALDAAFYDYRMALRSKKRALLSAHSGIVSTMIAGPSNFPARQMNKRNASYDNKVNEYLEFRTKALNRMCKTFAEPVGIRTGESGAADALQAKIDKAEELQARMKAANAAIRKNLKKGTEAKVAALVATGLTEAQAYKLLTPNVMGAIGFPDYEVRNNNANIRRMKEQLAKAKSLASAETTERMIGDVKIIDNLEDDRLQMFFPVERVARPIYDLLKSHGFRWTPSTGCFQAYRGNSANYWCQIIAKDFNEQKEVA